MCYRLISIYQAYVGMLLPSLRMVQEFRMQIILDIFLSNTTEVHTPKERSIHRYYLFPCLPLLPPSNSPFTFSSHPVPPSWADRSSHYLTKWQYQQLSTQINKRLHPESPQASPIRHTGNEVPKGKHMHE